MSKVKVIRSSGNVFADLGLPHPEERLAKAALALELTRLIEARGLTQRAAAAVLGIDQPNTRGLFRLAQQDMSSLHRSVPMPVRPVRTAPALG